MLHTGWSSTRCKSCGDGMDGWKPSFWHVLAVAPIAVTRRDLSPVTGTVSQATKTNGIEISPCSYLYRSRHWIGNSTSSLHPCCRHQGGRLLMVHVFNCAARLSQSPCPFWIYPWHKTRKIMTYGKWSDQANTQAQWSHASVSVLRLAPTILWFCAICFLVGLDVCNLLYMQMKLDWVKWLRLGGIISPEWVTLSFCSSSLTPESGLECISTCTLAPKSHHVQRLSHDCDVKWKYKAAGELSTTLHQWGHNYKLC